jgi:hypothetical protein
MIMNTTEDKNLLNLLVRAVELIEEVYERQPELIHDDHAQSYTDIIAALNARSVSYKGNPQIMQMSHDFNPLKAFGKMPMEKAKPGKNKAERRNAS